MGDHFMASDELREALIRGDLATARQSARDLADHVPSSEIPPTWRAFVVRLKQRASELARADDIPAAALAMGRLGLACAACHTAEAAEIEFSAAPPTSGDDPQSHMLRHEWASERMWEGLIGPSDGLFRSAGDALLDAPLQRDTLKPTHDLAPAAEALARRVHQLADEAAATIGAEPPKRAELYGKFLATCAACHGLLHAGPTQ